MEKLEINKDISSFTYHLNEAYPRGLQYAFIDDNNKIRHKPCRCKDYVQDIYWSEILNKPKTVVYGFEWDGKNEDPISKKEWVKVVLMSDNTTKLDNKIENISNLLRPFELTFKIKKTKFQLTTNKNDIVIIYNNKWAEKPYLISLFFALIRAGVFYDGKPNKTDVCEWLENKAPNLIQEADKQNFLMLKTKNKIKKLLYNKYFNNQNWIDYIEPYGIHNNSGIVSFNI